MKSGLNFKIENDRIEISTAQSVDFDEFVKRIANIEAQKENFKMQKNFSNNQIEEAKKNIEIIEKNTAAAEEDLEKAYQFLRLNHREDLIKKIEAKVEETKKQMAAAQMQQAQI